MSEQTKDPMFSFRTVILGKNSKTDELNPAGGERIQLYLNPDDVVGIIESLTVGATNPKGMKLDIHLRKKMAKQGKNAGRAFQSGIMFIKPVTEGGAGGAPAQAAPAAYKPKPQASQAELADRVAKAKASLNNPPKVD